MFFAMEIKTVGVRELKDSLSSYLREVKSGVVVLVTDRGRVVAQLTSVSLSAPVGGDLLLSEWIERGDVISPRRVKADYGPSPVRLEDGVSLRLLDLDRGK